jgi:hypothetical protein
MVASLRPAVSGGTPSSILRVSIVHGLGLLLGALLMGLVLVVVGSAASTIGARQACQVLLLVALAVAVLQCFGVKVPQSRWQVPEYWRRFLDPDVLPFAYGSILGMGVFTAVVVGAFWGFVVATSIYGALPALLGWLAYGAGRAIGFRAAIQMPEMALSDRQRWWLTLATTLLAAGVAVR